MRTYTTKCDACGATPAPTTVLLRNCEADLCIVCADSPIAKGLLRRIEASARNMLGPWSLDGGRLGQ